VDIPFVYKDRIESLCYDFQPNFLWKKILKSELPHLSNLGPSIIVIDSQLFQLVIEDNFQWLINDLNIFSAWIKKFSENRFI